MTDWAAKVLEGVERHTPPYTNGNWITEADALAAIAKLAEGDGLVAELEMSARIWTIAADHKEAPTFSRGDCRVWAERFTNAAAHIAALTAERDDYAEQISTLLPAVNREAVEQRARAEAAEAEVAALRVERDIHTKKWQEWAEIAHAATDRGMKIEAENTALRAKVTRLEGALRKLHHAVCGETGFAAYVRWDSGKAYLWPALDDADETARAALTEKEKSG